MEGKKSAQIKSALIQKCGLAGVPVSGTLELTPRCNLGCRMCYVRLTPEQMAPIGRERTAAEWLALAKEAKEEGLLFLLLTGGEPTLKEDFPEIYEGLAQMGLSISINTNGTMFNEKLKDLFHRYPPAQVNITLYGTSQEDYLRQCNNAKAYDAVIDAIQWLKKEHILLHLNATMTPSNADKWKEFEDFAKDRDLELRMNTYCFPPVRRGECKEFERLLPEEAGELFVRDIQYREGQEAIDIRKKSLSQIKSTCKLDIGNPIDCMAGSSQFWMNWNGTMVPCGMLEMPSANPFEKSFKEAWQELKNDTKEVHLCADCANCAEKKTCMTCAAVTFTETGRFDGKPEYMCRMNKAYREALDKYSTS
ncbi:MAG: radical SAM protein [Agathobacter sp.]|nr:radical SAM protein [Agathobacter sp.]